MRTLYSVFRGIIPIALALLSGTRILPLDCVTRVLQVRAFQFDDFPSIYHAKKRVWNSVKISQTLDTSSAINKYSRAARDASRQCGHSRKCLCKCAERLSNPVIPVSASDTQSTTPNLQIARRIEFSPKNVNALLSEVGNRQWRDKFRL